MTHVEVTIGWTRSDPATGYSSFEGYEPGASQHTETVSVNIEQAGLAWEATRDHDKFIRGLADDAFLATNVPAPEDMVETSSPGQIYTQLRDHGFNGSQSGHYSLSVGDTVTVGEVTLACTSWGWERVAITPPETPRVDPGEDNPALKYHRC